MDNHHKETGKLALAAIDADALAKDLLKPTDERVRNCVADLMAASMYLALEKFTRNPAAKELVGETISEAGKVITDLLTENKALREKCRQIEITAEMLADQYNPSTHVAVERGQLSALADRLNAVRPGRDESADLGDTLLAITMEIRAMLTATEEEG